MANITIIYGKQKISVSVSSNKLVSSILKENGIAEDTPCGGKGICGQCKIKAFGALSKPTKNELNALSSKELSNGYRLSCQVCIAGDATIEILNDEIFEQIANASQISLHTDDVYNGFGISIDIGTTTLSAQLYNGNKLVHTVGMKNPQTQFGADVISRMEHWLRGEGGLLASVIKSAIVKLASALCKKANIGLNDVQRFVFTGNTVMFHLLRDINPKPLTHAPFKITHYFGEWVLATEISPVFSSTAKIYLPRCISGFVGADITTAILSSKLCEQKGASMLIDIGTNGEIVLWHNGEIICCSTAAGPAFEGVGIRHGVYGVPGAIDKIWHEDGVLKFSTIENKPPIGICGSGIVDGIATLLQMGVLDETGAFDEAEDLENRLHEIDKQPAYKICENIYITAKDVRQIQLAKGSMRAGIETICQTAGIETNMLSVLYIAGGFGSFLNLNSAATIGLIPKVLLSKTKVVGNAAGAGAAILLQSDYEIMQSIKIAKTAKTISLDANENFGDNYMQHMMFESED